MHINVQMLQKELKVERVIVFLVDQHTMGVLHILLKVGHPKINSNF
jgi:hypothetical protein